MGRGKAKKMMNYSGMFDRKAENSQVRFRTGPNKPPLASHSLCSIKSKLISTTSVTALAV